MTEDRIGFLLGKLHTDQRLTPAEIEECGRLGIKTSGERPRPRRTAADVAALTGCSAKTFERIFGPN